MSIGNELRIERLRRLHTKFLNASDSHPQLYHACLRSGDPNLDGVLRCHHKGPFPSPIERELWLTALVNSERGGDFSGEFLSSSVFLHLQSGEWMGRYIGWANENALGDFCVLSEDVLVEIKDVSEHRRFADAPWLETLYDVIACPDETVVISDCCNILPEGQVEVTGLPWNVFLSSAKAIEMLIDRKPWTVGTPAEPLSSNPSRMSTNQAARIRPAYKRDHLWLKWSEEESLKPAKIRDRWDAMSDESWKEVCSGACDRVGDGSKKAGRDVVVKGIKKARREFLFSIWLKYIPSVHRHPNPRASNS